MNHLVMKKMLAFIITFLVYKNGVSIVKCIVKIAEYDHITRNHVIDMDIANSNPYQP